MKKMRRLIPAFAMLMVAAIMLSTASFAWFTMNDEVTASGMQIQAKADGSLLISQAPFSDANLGTPDVEISANVKNLKPMAYAGDVDGAQLTDLSDGWYQPADNTISNTITGANTGDFEEVETLTGYTFKEQFYIATAGEALVDADFTITLTSPVHPATGETHKAYAAAIYVIADKTDDAWAATGDVDFLEDAPAAILFVGEGDTDGRCTTTLTYTVPSIAGAVDGNTVGLKVIAYFYVDGALQSETNQQTVTIGYEHTAVTGKWDADVTYYTFDEATLDKGTNLTGYYVLESGKYVPATGTAEENGDYFERSVAVATDDIKNGGDTALNNLGWYIASAAKTQRVNYSYVRSADVPSTGSTLKLAFSAEVEAAD